MWLHSTKCIMSWLLNKKRLSEKLCQVYVWGRSFSTESITLCYILRSPKEHVSLCWWKKGPCGCLTLRKANVETACFQVLPNTALSPHSRLTSTSPEPGPLGSFLFARLLCFGPFSSHHALFSCNFLVVWRSPWEKLRGSLLPLLQWASASVFFCIVSRWFWNQKPIENPKHFRL